MSGRELIACVESMTDGERQKLVDLLFPLREVRVAGLETQEVSGFISHQKAMASLSEEERKRVTYT
jgi:signal recognition particle GTPase